MSYKNARYTIQFEIIHEGQKAKHPLQTLSPPFVKAAHYFPYDSIFKGQ